MIISNSRSGFMYLTGKDQTHSVSSNLFHSYSNRFMKKIFLCPAWTPQAVIDGIAPCWTVYHYWKKFGAIIFVPPFDDIVNYTKLTPLSSASPGPAPWKSQLLNCSHYIMLSMPPTSLASWTQDFSTSSLYWGLPKQHTVVQEAAPSRDDNNFLQSASHVPPSF